MPNIGYGSAKKTKHMLPNGFRKVLVHNIKVSFGNYNAQVTFVLLNVAFIFNILGIGSPNDDEPTILRGDLPRCLLKEA